MKRKLGCWLHERWRTELVLRFPRLAGRFGFSWLDLCNRLETLGRSDNGIGRLCQWQDSSALTVVSVFPSVGSRILGHAMRDWQFAQNVTASRAIANKPRVSILIPVGGIDRLAQFEAALSTARAQQGVDLEIVVVEQSPIAALREHLPDDVKYFHQPVSGQSSEFNKSWALNRAARAATGEVLILLDADLLIPRDFAVECHRALRDAEAIRPGRFVFYLDKPTSELVIAKKSLDAPLALESAVANTPMPIAVRASTYWEIGGHDEAYAGWGGEDTEFLDRLRTRKIDERGWAPIIHAWHAPSAKKGDGDRNRELHSARMNLSAAERIRLLATVRGGGESPCAWRLSATRLESVADAREGSPVR